MKFQGKNIKLYKIMCTSDENFCKDTFCELKPIGPNKVLFSAGSNFLKPQKNVYVNFLWRDCKRKLRFLCILRERERNLN